MSQTQRLANNDEIELAKANGALSIVLKGKTRHKHNVLKRLKIRIKKMAWPDVVQDRVWI
jgi:hypothetical protein